MANRMPASRKTQVRFLRFFVVGGTSYLVNVGSFALLKKIGPPNPAFTASFILSVATHYLLNRFWALPSTRRDTGRQFAEYLATSVISYLISFSIFHLFHDAFGCGLGWSQAVSIPPATIVVFCILNFRVFRHHGGGDGTASHG